MVIERAKEETQKISFYTEKGTNEFKTCSMSN